MKVLGMVLFYGAGVVMLVFELFWFHQWWGGVGLAVALFVPPAAALFPFVFLFMEGFSLLYFGLWAIGLAGIAAVGAGDP